jgi:uncharacterized protein with GYD domain
MGKYIFVGAYSTGSWARMIRSTDDRITLARHFAEALGGSLECMYWEMSTRSIYTIADLPDSTCAAAAAAVLTQSGAFKYVESHELLTQDQLGDVLALAGDVSKLYEVPGHSVVETVEHSR